MLSRIMSVGGLTLVSRIAGFLRDIMLAAILGAGPVADAFFVALRLPNHFRAIFAEGAFNAAFVPAYARLRQQNGPASAGLFADRIFTLLLASQILLLLFALAFTPAVIELLAPGFEKDPVRFALAVELTRITFPYLLLMTLVTLFSGMLNAIDRFAAAAAAPIILNLMMMAALALAAFFPSAGHAAAWGVVLAGVLEVILVGADAKRAGIMVVPRWPQWDADIRRFFKALVPATVGSAGVQLALFADTIIASFLTVGAVSALYYADRLNQLPIGVIGIAAGTVVLPEMARRIAAGDERGARHAQDRAIEMTVALAIPFVVGFVIVPDLVMRALFTRGAFTAADAAASAATLRAYALGLLPFVLIRSLVATFFARGDTATPVKASLTAAAVNIALKVALMGTLAQVGLALATSVGAWINVALVLWFALRRRLIVLDAALLRPLARLMAAGAVLAAVIWSAHAVLDAYLDLVRWKDQAMLAALAFVGAIVYGTALLFLYRARWRGVSPAALRR
ncbi:MAG: murein biosynthesis integral membrane protein MurJ [Variibacter sp.]